MAARVGVALEQGRTRCFAIALDWPGWARSATSEHDALDALASYRDRYAGVLATRDVAAPTGTLFVAERVRGDATTDFGAPGAVCDADHRALRASDRARMRDVLLAAWSCFDVAVDARPTLRTGPRGGGRDVDKMAAHVADAELAYARKLGLRLAGTDGAGSDPSKRRDRIASLVVGDAPADREAAWPLRYGVRRIAWHVLDHLFEIEDRTTGR